jgi:hypothetical protein
MGSATISTSKTLGSHMCNPSLGKGLAAFRTSREDGCLQESVLKMVPKYEFLPQLVCSAGKGPGRSFQLDLCEALPHSSG